MKQLKGYNGSTVRTLESQALDKYKNMNEDALVDALMENVKRSKSEGTFSPQAMKEFAQMMSPHLSPAKRERLDNLIRLISSDV